jgi:hypothetical protein
LEVRHAGQSTAIGCLFACPAQVSAAAAFVKTGAFNPARTLLLLLAATAIIAWLNLRWAGWFTYSTVEGAWRLASPPAAHCDTLPSGAAAAAGKAASPHLPSSTAAFLLLPACSNDVFDSVTGVDTTKPESVVNLLGGNARLVFLIATTLLVAGGGLLFWLLESAVSLPGHCTRALAEALLLLPLIR